MNLLEETLTKLEMNGKSEKDVKWVGDIKSGYINSHIRSFSGVKTWSEFKKIAKNIDYDNGYGGVEISENLVVVGDNWWLERHEYDGSEWWEFKTLPKKENYL